MAEPLRQPRELLDLDSRPHPVDDLGDWVRLLAAGIGAVLHNQKVLHDLLVRVDRKEDQEMADLTALSQAVADATTVEESAITLLDGLAAQLAAAATDPAAIQAIVDSITSEKDKLAADVAKNTPAAP